MNTIKTKFNESKVTITMNDVLSGAKDAEFRTHEYLATNMTRSYPEEMVNADTGELVPIRKCEIIAHRGDIITDNIIAEMRFHAQCGELDDFAISDQSRAGVAYQSSNMTVWKVSVVVVVDNKLNKKTFLLYACSMEQAVEIVTDYAEQTFDGAFQFTAVKSYHNCRIINRSFTKAKENQDDDTDMVFDTMFYMLDCVIEDSGNNNNMIGSFSFLCSAGNAERAKEIVHDYIAIKMADENKDETSLAQLPFTVNPETMRITIISANIVKCSNVIHPDFSMTFINQSKTTDNNE